jgi:hypothetical protein
MLQAVGLLLRTGRTPRNRLKASSKSRTLPNGCHFSIAIVYSFVFAGLPPDGPIAVGVPAALKRVDIKTYTYRL